ncbi:ElaA protein [Ewingella americana]
MTDSNKDILWQDIHHSKLNVAQLYAILALRSEVFVVEQNCPYQDIDGRDLVGENRHIIGWQNGLPVAYLRILDLDGEVAIGRVIIAPAARGLKLGYQLMERALQSCKKHWPDAEIILSAQAHLQKFYGSFGFVAYTDIYDEDGIPHISMKLGAGGQNGEL